MTPEKNLKNELLKQNGVSTDKANDLRDKILARDKARVARMRKLVVVAWALVAACPVAMAISHLLPLGPKLERVLPALLIIPLEGLFLIAVIFTISVRPIANAHDAPDSVEPGPHRRASQEDGAEGVGRRVGPAYAVWGTCRYC